MRRSGCQDWDICVRFPHLKLLNSNTVVREHDQLVAGNVLQCLELGGQKQAGRPKELELVGGNPGKIFVRTEIFSCQSLLPANCQEPVQKVDSQSEDLWSVLTAVITHVEHPANYQLPHVRLDLNLDECEIVRVAGKISV